ncbi:aldehyde dehydrogenase family protein, partial [Acinetobacter sp. Ver3]|uniref:aldehyde dehydrogenase family protein n=1 Tax=Acinetobacter sp. Ver3 TaxID=466088 RepID=UPI0012DB0985
FYPFSNNRKLIKYYISNIMSGGVSINDALFHVGQHDLPFGGIGASGMGQYHGYEGFLTFSKMRPIFHQAGFSSLKYLAPPYGNLANKILHVLLKIKS